MRKPKGFFNIKDGAHRAALLIAYGVRNIPVLVFGDAEGEAPRDCSELKLATPDPLAPSEATPTLHATAVAPSAPVMISNGSPRQASRSPEDRCSTV